MSVIERRRLTDLYARGVLVEIDDGEGEPVSVWLRKLTPVDAEAAYVKASARRAAFMTLSRGDPPTDLLVALRAEIEQFTADDLVTWLSTQELLKRRDLIETRVSYDEEWQKDRYLSGLQERLLQTDFQIREAETPDDPEIKGVHDELDRYADQVEQALQEERQTLIEEYQALTDEERQKQVIDLMLDSQADSVWVSEFQRCQIWLCSFNPDKRNERLFQDREEVDLLQTEVVHRLSEELDKLHVGELAGKDSQQTPDSSPPVE